MPTETRNRGLSAILCVSATLLITLTIALANIIQRSNGGSIPSATVLKDAAVELLLNPITTKTPVPFGRKGALQISVDGNETSIQRGPEVRRDAVGLRKRLMTWDQALSKGQAALNLLGGTREQSEWATVQQVEEKGWSLIHKDDEDDVIMGGEKGSDAGTGGGSDGDGSAGSDASDSSSEGGVILEPTDLYSEPNGPYDSLHIDKASENRWENFQDKTFSNCHHDDNAPTEATYDNIYNAQSKTIVALLNFGPPYKLKEKNIPDWQDRLPDVWNWSNLVWPTWVHVAGNSAGKLRYIFRREVATDDTRAIMTLAAPSSSHVTVDGMQQFRSPWPGFKFVRGDQQFQALLGTAHGTGIVRLVTQHPNELGGDKNIESINIFTTLNHYSGEPDDTSYDMLFTLTGAGN